jgi:hypothetical protein
MVDAKYEYKSVKSDGRVEPYSPRFNSLGAAHQWYRKHGIHAERVLGRNLVFNEYRDYKIYNQKKQPSSQKRLPFSWEG